MSAFEEHWNKEIRPYIHNSNDIPLAKYWWKAALKWASGESCCGGNYSDKLPQCDTKELIRQELEEA